MQTKSMKEETLKIITFKSHWKSHTLCHLSRCGQLLSLRHCWCWAHLSIPRSPLPSLPPFIPPSSSSLLSCSPSRGACNPSSTIVRTGGYFPRLRWAADSADWQHSGSRRSSPQSTNSSSSCRLDWLSWTPTIWNLKNTKTRFCFFTPVKCENVSGLEIYTFTRTGYLVKQMQLNEATWCHTVVV